MVLEDVMVVGAGIAGIVCAQRLQQAGYRVRTLEKSRGLGGRMATRRMEGMPIDHGAKFLQPQGTMSDILIEQLAACGIVKRWQPHIFDLDGAGRLTSQDLADSYYVAPDGMSAVGKAMATGLTVERQCRVTAIAPSPPENHWQVTAEPSQTAEVVTHGAQALVLAIPAPQAGPLLAPLQTHSAMAAMVAAVGAVSYAPSVTVMAQYKGSTATESASLPCAPTDPWMVNGHEDTPFGWIGLDSSKHRQHQMATAGVSVVFQSSAAFAEQWLEAPDLQPAGEQLLTQAGALVAPWLAHPMRWQVHRWRYAQVKTPCPETLLSAAEPCPLVVCGDWCGMRQIESALAAGWAAAAQINKQLDQRSLLSSFAPLAASLLKSTG